jgi:flagellar hook assembly protein FlgD
MKTLLASFALFVCLSALPARAALGGDVNSIDADQAQMKGSVELKQSAAYVVHQIKASSGTTVREYVSSAGTVFAVAWNGPFLPDLQQLLGSYFDQYSAGVKADKASYIGRRPLNVQLPGLVVQMTGHVRDYHGRAYLPNQVPGGIKAEDLW